MGECKLPYCKDCGGAYRILLIFVGVIFLYFLFLRSTVGDGKIQANDLLNRKVFDLPWLENCCSWWPISHYVLFLLLGVTFPDCGVPLVTAGVAWELFEVAVSSFEGTKRQKIYSSPKKVEYSKNWWAGSFKDVLMNTAGFATGWFIAKKLGVKVCINGLNDGTEWCSKEECKACLSK